MTKPRPINVRVSFHQQTPEQETASMEAFERYVQAVVREVVSEIRDEQEKLQEKSVTDPTSNHADTDPLSSQAQ